MWVRGQKQLENLLLRERVLMSDLDHELAHSLDVRSLEECLGVHLHLLKVTSLERDQAFLERSAILIHQNAWLSFNQRY